MITGQQVAKILQDDLNKLADGFTFAIFTDYGSYQKSTMTKTVVNGLLMQYPSEIVPIAGLNNFYMTYGLNVVSDTLLAQKVKDVLEQFVETAIGSVGEIGDYVYSLGLDNLGTGVVAQRAGVGTSVTYGLTLYYQFIRGGILSNQCKYYIDGEEIITLEASVSRVKTPQSAQVFNSPDVLAYVNQQAISFSFVVPYTKANVIQGLSREIFLGGLEQTHTVGYDDPAVDKRAEYLCVLVEGAHATEPNTVATQTYQFVQANPEVYEVTKNGR